MTDVKDDPRDVLALLNSLGFVGITAPQLKAFMKDLKMHRKIKERERQQWKEDTRKKILTKQEGLLNKMLHEIIAEKISNSLENIPPSNNASQQEDPLVRIRVHCVSETEENEDIENVARHGNKASAQKRQVHLKTERLCRKESHGTVDSLSTKTTSTRRRRERSKSHNRPRVAEVSTDSSQYVSVERKNVSPRKVSQEPTQRSREARMPARPLSAPEFTSEATMILKKRSKSVASDPTGLANTRNNPSRCSARSQTKSFIRPWRLQPEAQRTATARKSDPVAMYQKYKEEWKHISFPGEEKHAHVRWAIREKMLGTDPNPRPILKKSQSLMSIKKR